MIGILYQFPTALARESCRNRRYNLREGDDGTTISTKKEGHLK